ncbi:O-antigen ligase family protein [Candidatus Saccharibacteria bacterium]|nr:O-antigen ligase family protein [Candidatus Saccharibacteria bacterium]
MMKKNALLAPSQVARVGNLIILVSLLLLPFHAFFSTWLGSITGYLDLIRIWKEIVLLLCLFIAFIVVFVDRSQLWRGLLQTSVIRWALLFTALTLFVGAVTLRGDHVSVEAVMYGLIIQLRLAAVFVLAALFALYDNLLIRRWKQIVLIPAVVVVVFGLMQLLVLPYDFLRHFGYGPDTIPAFQTIDGKLAFQRYQSTMRGANPLGAYLLLVIMTLVIHLYQKRRDYAAYALLTGSTILLYFTYSRSAWLGLLVGLAVVGLVKGRQYLRRSSLVAMVIVLVVLLFGLWTQRNNDYIQNTFFHSDETSQAATSSNQQRGQALRGSIEEVRAQPWGGGVGSAGPASARNDYAPARIAENYFIQVGQELGWAGFVLFIGLMTSLGLWLWGVRNDEFGLVLLSSFVGISVINLVSHAWADDTLALLWWGLAGVCFGRGILNKAQTKQNHEKQKNKRI